MARVIAQRRLQVGEQAFDVLWLAPAPAEEFAETVGGEVVPGDLRLLSGETRAQVRVQPLYAVVQASELGAQGDRVPRVRRLAVLTLQNRLIVVAAEDAETPRRLLQRTEEANDPFDLFFLLWDDLVERFLEASERTVAAAEEVSQRVLIGPKKGLGHATYRVRRAAFAVRLAVARAHAAFAVLDAERPTWWPGSAERRCHEIRERISAVHEDVEAVREALGETVEAYTSVQSNDMNKVMQVLTLVSLLFLPPTLIASIYGMNFRIPEYAWPNGYAYALGLMAVLTGGIVFWARLRNWLR